MKNVLIYTTFGISKSIVRSEYLWLKSLLIELKKQNPEISFFFDSYISKQKSKDKRLNEFQKILEQNLIPYTDQNIDRVFFTAIPPAGFFGGLMNERDINNWINLVNWSHKSKVYLRVADSEQCWVNIRNLYIQRFAKISDFSSDEFTIVDQKFYDNNKIAQILIKTKELNWENIHPLMNGNLSNWEEKYFVNNQNTKIFDDVPIEIIKKNSIYLSDDLFFLIREQDEKIEFNSMHNDKLLFIGFLSGHNKNREKVLSNYMNLPLYVQTDNSGSLIPNVAEINDKKIPGDNEDYFKFINQHLAGFFIGKGKAEDLDYINKSVYDFLIAKIPVLVWSEVKLEIFKDLDCHFSNSDDVELLIHKLKVPEFRKALLEKQREIIFSKLETISNSIKLL